MKLRTLALVASLALASAAHATKPTPAPEPSNAQAVAGAAALAGAAAVQSQNASSTSGGNVISVQGDAAPTIPVASAWAAGLTAANGTCMGSTSAGAQGVTVGLSFGSTWVDAGCDMRYDAQALVAAGQAGAAVARLCQKPEIAQAMADAGTPCRKATAAAAKVAGYEGSDPFVLRRLAAK